MTDETRTVDQIIAEARGTWCSAMAQFTELPLGVYEEAFDLAVALGASKGRIEGVIEAFDKLQAHMDDLEKAHATESG